MGPEECDPGQKMGEQEKEMAKDGGEALPASYQRFPKVSIMEKNRSIELFYCVNIQYEYISSLLSSAWACLLLMHVICLC